MSEKTNNLFTLVYLYNPALAKILEVFESLGMHIYYEHETMARSYIYSKKPRKNKMMAPSFHVHFRLLEAF